MVWNTSISAHYLSNDVWVSNVAIMPAVIGGNASHVFLSVSIWAARMCSAVTAGFRWHPAVQLMPNLTWLSTTLLGSNTSISVSFHFLWRHDVINIFHWRSIFNVSYPGRSWSIYNIFVRYFPKNHYECKQIANISSKLCSFRVLCWKLNNNTKNYSLILCVLLVYILNSKSKKKQKRFHSNKD
jgi:hypothetical protein